MQEIEIVERSQADIVFVSNKTTPIKFENNFIIPLKFMMNESIFRALLLIIFITFAVIWSRSFILSGIKRDAFYTSAEGLIVAVLLRFLLTAGILSMFIYIINPSWMKWSSLPFPFWLRLIGLPLGLLAICLLFWALQSLGSNFHATLTTEEDQVLITSGLYRWVRHPMYITLVLLWIAYFVLSANWFIGLTGILAYVLIIIMRTPKEEQMMIDRFGEEYLTYMKRTGRYFPRRNIYDRGGIGSEAD